MLHPTFLTVSRAGPFFLEPLAYCLPVSRVFFFPPSPAPLLLSREPSPPAEDRITRFPCCKLRAPGRGLRDLKIRRSA